MRLPEIQHAVPSDSREDLVRLTVLVTLAVFLTDVASKNWAISALGGGYADLSLLALTVEENSGLAFSVGAGALSSLGVLALRLVVLAVVLLLTLRFGPRSLRFAVGFALVLGGGLGNASDALLRDGAVVDFISTAPISRALFGSPTAQGVVMNLADIWILTGLVLLYPLFRLFGRAVQRRFQALEARLLGPGWSDRLTP